MLDHLDRHTSLTMNQWKIFTACLFSIMVDFFDFSLIGFVLAFFVRDWHLTFGQSGAILFASGVGTIPGAIFFGWLGDRLGHRGARRRTRGPRPVRHGASRDLHCTGQG
jgi:putative MFS transporter